MSVLSVHLACRSWSDLGVVLLEQAGPQIGCEIIRWQNPGRVPFAPPVVELALRLNTLCQERDANVLMLDGSQAWISEKAMQTISEDAGWKASGETATPWTQERFVGYCLALYEALGRLGWQRTSARQSPSGIQNTHKTGQPPRLLVESYPSSVWKSLGLAPLPERSICRVSDLATAYTALAALLPITTSQPPDRGQLEAIIGGLPGLAIEDRVAFRINRAKSPIAKSQLGLPVVPSSEEGNMPSGTPELSRSSRPIPRRSADAVSRPT
jgi:hypothetical protein